MALGTLNDVFNEQIEDLYSSETQLVSALPKFAAAVSDEPLRQAIEAHIQETQRHVQRLEEIKQELGLTGARTCKGMAGLLEEAEDVLRGPGAGASRDAAIIAAAQRVEHYEISAYGTARTLADQLGFDNAKRLLTDTLGEESAADKHLGKIATGGLLHLGLNAKASA